jgi:hypothetical protein
MIAKVTNISNNWRPVKKGQESGLNMVNIFQALENETFNGVSLKIGSTIKLNLNSEQKNKQDWLDALTEGNVLDVDLYQMGKILFVSKYNSPKIIKKVTNGKKAINND